MKNKLWLAMGWTLVMAGCASAPTTDSILENALETMGNPSSIQYSGTGTNGAFGQAPTAGDAWPGRDLSSFSRTINYEQRSMRDELNFAQPVFGGQQQDQRVNGDRAWAVTSNGPQPQIAAADERQLHIWLTPHGFLKGAMASGNATLSSSNDGNVVSFAAMGRYNVMGTIDANNQVAQVRTTIGTPVLGDTELVANYSDYQDFGGVQFPARIQIDQGGFPVWDLNITSVTTDVEADFPAPEAVQAATAPPVQTVSTMLAPGVWHVTGGSHHSVVVEFDEYLAIVEAPLNEERSMAVIAEARNLAPNKPVQYLITTHHHFDHTGGFRTYVAEGATIVTHQSNVAYFQQAAMAPATVMPDQQARSRQQPVFEGVSDEYVITDGNQTIEVYATDGDTHTSEYTLIYLPGPRILVEADAYSPFGPPDAPPPSTPPPNAVKLYEDMQRLQLNVATVAPIHGRAAVPIAELRRFIGS